MPAGRFQRKGPRQGPSVEVSISKRRSHVTAGSRPGPRDESRLRTQGLTSSLLLVPSEVRVLEEPACLSDDLCERKLDRSDGCSTTKEDIECFRHRNLQTEVNEKWFKKV